MSGVGSSSSRSRSSSHAASHSVGSGGDEGNTAVPSPMRGATPQRGAPTGSSDQDSTEAPRSRTPLATGSRATSTLYSAGLAPQFSQPGLVARPSAEAGSIRLPAQASSALNNASNDASLKEKQYKRTEFERMASMSSEKRALIDAARNKSQAEKDASRAARKKASEDKPLKITARELADISLDTSNAHFAPTKDKAKKEQKELTAEQLEKKSLGMLKKHYTLVAKEAGEVGAQKIREAEAAKTTPPKMGPYEARPASAFGSRTQMTWGTNPKAATSTPFRHSDAPLRTHAPTDRIDSRSMVDDLRRRANMKPRPTLLASHRIPEAAQFEKVSEWNDKNRAKARNLADSHGNRVPAGGWPKMRGTDEAKQSQSVREIDSVLRHPEIQVKLAVDTRFGPVIRYRAPEKHQEGLSGVVNTGRGAVYDKNGLVHLLSNDRPPDILEAQQAKYDLQDAKRKAKKEAKNAGI